MFCLFFIFILLFFLQKGFDVFNALDLMENKVFLEKLKFGIGDGNLQYYLYNWKCPTMDSDKVSSLCLEVLITPILFYVTGSKIYTESGLFLLSNNRGQ